MQSLVFFNNKGGVGKTSLVYHLGWTFSQRLDIKTLLIDLDPQANLTAMCLDEERQIQILDSAAGSNLTIQGALNPLIKGIGPVAMPHIESLDDTLFLIPGDLSLSSFEDALSDTWPKCLDSDERSFRVQCAFYHVMQYAVEKTHAELILVDVGPNLGAINRSALIASQSVLLPVAPDLYSLKGMENLGPKLTEWKKAWAKRITAFKEINPAPDFTIPEQTINPIGYLVINPSIRAERPAKAYQRWMNRVPDIYREKILNLSPDAVNTPVDLKMDLQHDPNRLETLRHYQSLMPMAMEHHKPMFNLTVADGAIGAHLAGVQRCGQEFEALAGKILKVLE
jgi:chromosome partitioning protein